MGCRWSEVQILSPRPIKSKGCKDAALFRIRCRLAAEYARSSNIAACESASDSFIHQTKKEPDSKPALLQCTLLSVDATFDDDLLDFHAAIGFQALDKRGAIGFRALNDWVTFPLGYGAQPTRLDALVGKISLY
jgi:hypothetical protein